MSRNIALIVICILSYVALVQASKQKYETGTVTSVTAHAAGPQETGNGIARYDVSVKIGNTIYVVLYTPPNGANAVEYAPGIDMLFLVGPDSLTFNSKLSGTTTVPILSREDLPAQRGIDWSKAPGQYFSIKLQHLSETLNLSEDQQATIKPTLEQESGEVGQIMKNPVLTRKEKLSRFEKIVRASDAKIKPILSTTQLQKLEKLRREQKKDVKTYVAERSRVERH